jgi:hypothetical protein
VIELDLAQRVDGGRDAGAWRATMAPLHAERLLEEWVEDERKRHEGERCPHEKRRH